MSTFYVMLTIPATATHTHEILNLCHSRAKLMLENRKKVLLSKIRKICRLAESSYP